MKKKHATYSISNAKDFRLDLFVLAIAVAWAGSAYGQDAPAAGSPDNSAATANVLPAVTVSSTRDLDATTEGSGSYAAQAATVAGKVPQSLQRIPNSVSVITRQRMDDQNMTSLQDALQYTTGVTATSYGDGTYYFTSRGYMLGIEFDGVSLLSGIQYSQQLDLGFYDRVEVFRGPAGVMDGAGTPGGTVNMVRKRPLDKFHVETETQVSSFGGARQMVDVTGPLNKEGTLRGRAVIIGSDEHASIDRMREKEAGFYGILEYDIDPRTTIALSAAHQVNPVSGYDYGIGRTVDNQIFHVPSSSNFSPSWNYSRTAITETNLNLVHRFADDWKWSTTVLYRRSDVSATYATPGAGYSAANGYTEAYNGYNQKIGTDWFGADTNVSGPVHLFGRDHTLTFGAMYSLYDNRSANGFGAIGTYNIFDAVNIPKTTLPYTSFVNDRMEQYGIYGQAQLKVTKPLSVILGGRQIWYQEKDQFNGADWTVESRLNGKFLPYAGIVYDIVPNISAYVSYSTIFAPQTGSTFGGEGIDPASGKQYEAGLKGTFMSGRLNANVAAFRIDNDHYEINDPNNMGYYLDAGKVRSQGWEAEVSGEPLPGWNVYAGYTLLNASYASGALPASVGSSLEEPRNLFKLYTAYRFQKGIMHGWMIGGGMLAQSGTTRLTTQDRAGGYAIFNAQVGYQFNKHVTASLTLNNIFNRDYYIRVPAKFYGEFGDSRNVMLTVRTDF